MRGSCENCPAARRLPWGKVLGYRLSLSFTAFPFRLLSLIFDALKLMPTVRVDAGVVSYSYLYTVKRYNKSCYCNIKLYTTTISIISKLFDKLTLQKLQQ